MVLSVLLRDMQWMLPVDCQTHTFLLPVNPVRCSHAHLFCDFIFNFLHIFPLEVHLGPIADVRNTVSPVAGNHRECLLRKQERTFFVLRSLLGHHMSLECCVCHYLHIFTSVERDYPVCPFLSCSVLSLVMLLQLLLWLASGCLQNGHQCNGITGNFPARWESLIFTTRFGLMSPLFLGLFIQTYPETQLVCFPMDVFPHALVFIFLIIVN